MENKSSISSSKYISSTLDNVTLNSNIFITQMKEALNILDSAALSIIIPILKIQNKILNKLIEEENRIKQTNIEQSQTKLKLYLEKRNAKIMNKKEEEQKQEKIKESRAALMQSRSGYER